MDEQPKTIPVSDLSQLDMFAIRLLTVWVPAEKVTHAARKDLIRQRHAKMVFASLFDGSELGE